MALATMMQTGVVERLARDHGTRGWRLAVSLMGNAADADDVMQQAYIIAARKEDFVPAENSWGWFAAVITNVARNARRARGRSSDRFRALEGDYHEDERAHDPSARAESEELCQRLRGELEALPETEREAVVLTHLSGMTHAMAAEALNVPLGTLKSHVRRGVERLRVRMAVNGTALAGAFSLVTIEQPAGGLAASLARWTGKARVSVSDGAPAWFSRIGANRLGSMTGSVFALLIGIGTGCLLTASFGGLLTSSSSLDLTPSGPANTAQTRTADHSTRVRHRADSHSNGHRGGSQAVPVATPRVASVSQPTAVEDPTPSLESPSQVEQPGTDDSVQAEANDDLDLPIPHGGWDKYKALGTIDWNELATGMNTYQELLEQVYRLRLQGLEVPDDLKARLALAGAEMERQKFRTVTRVYDGLPTNTRDGNGEWTHPAVSSNLMATRLAESGHALTESQIRDIVGLAGQYDRDWDALQSRAATMSAIDLLNAELAVKHQFQLGVNSILTPAQNDSLAGIHTRGISGLDAQSPANMIPVNPNHNGVVAASAPQARAMLMDRVAVDLGVPRNTLDGYEYVFDQWLNDANGMGSPTGISANGSLTTEQLMTATEAQSRAYRTLTEVAPHNKPLIDALNTASTVFVPQVGQPSPAPHKPGNAASHIGQGTIEKPGTPSSNASPVPAPSKENRPQQIPEGTLPPSHGSNGEVLPPAGESRSREGEPAWETENGQSPDGSVIAGLLRVDSGTNAATGFNPDDMNEAWRVLIDDSRFAAGALPGQMQ